MFTTVVGTIKCTIGPLHTLHLCIGLHVYYLIIIIIEALVWDYGPWGGHLFGGGCWCVTNTNGKMIFSFLNPGYSHICRAHQSNALLQYMHVLAGHGDTYIDLCMTRSTINQPVQQHQLLSHNNLLLYITGRTVLCLDSLPLISLLRLLLPISWSFKMCGFQRSRIHVPSFGKAFLYYSFVVIRISLLHVYNKISPGAGLKAGLKVSD